MVEIPPESEYERKTRLFKKSLEENEAKSSALRVQKALEPDESRQAVNSLQDRILGGRKKEQQQKYGFKRNQNPNGEVISVSIRGVEEPIRAADFGLKSMDEQAINYAWGLLLYLTQNQYELVLRYFESEAGNPYNLTKEQQQELVARLGQSRSPMTAKV